MKHQTLVIMTNRNDKLPYDPETLLSSKMTFGIAVFGQLVRSKGPYDIEPSLLSSWQWSQTEGALTLELRKDLVFHNGEEVTANDVEFGLLRWIYSDGNPIPKFDFSHMNRTGR